MLLQVRLGALAPRADAHGEVLIRRPRGRELVEVRAGVVVPDDEEADPVWTTAVLLCVHLRLWGKK